MTRKQAFDTGAIVEQADNVVRVGIMADVYRTAYQTVEEATAAYDMEVRSLSTPICVPVYCEATERRLEQMHEDAIRYGLF